MDKYAKTRRKWKEETHAKAEHGGQTPCSISRLTSPVLWWTVLSPQDWYCSAAHRKSAKAGSC